MDVRQAGLDDVADLTQLRAAWRGSQVTPEFAENFATWFRSEDASRLWWVAEEERDGAVGMVNLKLFERMPSPGSAAQWGYLANLFVLPEHRGEGIGAALVQAVVTWSQAAGLVRLVLSPSEASVSLYERLGFREAHELSVHPLD